MLSFRLPDLRRVPELRSSRRTLFVFDHPSDAWWISTWAGGEVRLTVEDLEEFFRHCLEHGARPG